MKVFFWAFFSIFGVKVHSARVKQRSNRLKIVTLRSINFSELIYIPIYIIRQKPKITTTKRGIKKQLGRLRVCSQISHCRIKGYPAFENLLLSILYNVGLFICTDTLYRQASPMLRQSVLLDLHNAAFRIEIETCKAE